MIRFTVFVPLFTGLAAIGLAGCESSGSAPPDPPQSAYDRYDEFVDGFGTTSYLRYDLEVTDAADLPMSGTASFDGYASVYIDNGGNYANVIGLGAMTAEFDAKTITGQFDDFAGVVFDDQGLIDPTEDASYFDGTLVVSDGQIGAAVPGAATVTLVGTLTGGGDEIGVDASMTGDFYGDTDPIEALRMDSGAGTVVTLNGTEVSGGVVLELR